MIPEGCGDSAQLRNAGSRLKRICVLFCSMQRIPRLGVALGMLCFFLTNTPLVAQTVHSKQIYLWDVTLSMKQNDIWDAVKDQMIQSLTEVKDEDTEVIVIPFQDDVYEEQRVTVGDKAALERLVNWIDGYDVPMPTGGHGTNICRALERAEDFVLKENIDCVFLLTDGTHEPKRPDMAQKHPQGCLEAYLNDRWCAFATELDAYLVYYHLLGSADPEIQQVTDETCRAMSVEPGDGTPDRLHYISPQVQLISRDEAFLADPTFSIPVTTSLAPSMYPLCEFTGSLVGSGFESPLRIEFTGTSLECALDAQAIQRLNRTFPASVDEVTYDLQVELSLTPVEEVMVALTADLIPFQFHHYQERWFELKIVEE